MRTSQNQFSIKNILLFLSKKKRKKPLGTIPYSINAIRDQATAAFKSCYHTLNPITQANRTSFLSLWIDYKFLKTAAYNGSADTTLTTAANALLL